MSEGLTGERLARLREIVESESALSPYGAKMLLWEIDRLQPEVARLTWELGLARERLREALHDLHSTGAELDVARYDLRKAREWNHQGDEG